MDCNVDRIGQICYYRFLDSKDPIEKNGWLWVLLGLQENKVTITEACISLNYRPLLHNVDGKIMSLPLPNPLTWTDWDPPAYYLYEFPEEASKGFLLHNVVTRYHTQREKSSISKIKNSFKSTWAVSSF